MAPFDSHWFSASFASMVLHRITYTLDARAGIEYYTPPSTLTTRRNAYVDIVFVVDKILKNRLDHSKDVSRSFNLRYSDRGYLSSSERKVGLTVFTPWFVCLSREKNASSDFCARFW